MSKIQELLDKEANMANTGQGNSDFRKIIHAEIKVLRGNVSPHCWGEDDCSINMLMHCPWRIDCGTTESTLPKNLDL
jgi:hypothetical protein